MHLFIEDPAGPVGGGAATRPDRSYSIQQESYRAELDFAERRDRLSRMRSVLRVVAIALAAPVALATAFLAAYLAACILGGATPDEAAALVGELLTRVATALEGALGA